MNERLRHLLNTQSGAALLMGVLASVAVMGVLLPFLVKMGGGDSSRTVQEKRSATALQLAEAGIERAEWKLREKETNWDQLLSNPSNAAWAEGYRNDAVYTDVPGGKYMVNISTELDAGFPLGKVIIEATGADSSGKVFRTVRAVYGKGPSTGLVPPPPPPPQNCSPVTLDAAVWARQIQFQGTRVPQWGGMMSVDAIQMQEPLSDQTYPRKYSRGVITGNGSYGNRDALPSPPNTGPVDPNHLEWWTYQGSNVVPDLPAPDLDHYRALAQSQGSYYSIPMQYNTAFADPTCTVGADPKVHYYAMGLQIRDEFYACGVMIVMGGFQIQGGRGHSVAGNLTVTPHADAWKDYTVNVPAHAGAPLDGNYTATGLQHTAGLCNAPHGDTEAPHEYPGDEGLRTVGRYNFVTGCEAHNNLGGVTGQPLFFKGYVYASGGFQPAATGRIYGFLHVDGTWQERQTMDVFHDPSVLPTIKFPCDNQPIAVPPPTPQNAGDLNIQQNFWFETEPKPFAF
jgi:hypothetical protein